MIKKEKKFIQIQKAMEDIFKIDKNLSVKNYLCCFADFLAHMSMKDLSVYVCFHEEYIKSYLTYMTIELSKEMKKEINNENNARINKQKN